MHGNRRHVCAAAHSAGGKSLAEIEMRSVRFVHQHFHAVAVDYLGDSAQVGADAVVGGIIHQHRFCVRVGEDSGFYLLRGHSEGYAEVVVHPGVDIHRYRTADYQCIYGASVDVSGQDYLLPCLAHRHHHSLNRSGGAVYNKNGVLRPECVGGDLLSLFYHRNRVTEIIKRLHGIHVVLQAAFAEEFVEQPVPSATLMPGYVKRDDPVEPVRFHCFVQRRTALVKTVFSHLPHLSRYSCR